MAAKCALEAVLIKRAAEMSEHWGKVYVLGISICPPMGATQSAIIPLNTEVLVVD